MEAPIKMMITLAVKMSFGLMTIFGFTALADSEPSYNKAEHRIGNGASHIMKLSPSHGELARRLLEMPDTQHISQSQEGVINVDLRGRLKSDTWKRLEQELKLAESMNSKLVIKVNSHGGEIGQDFYRFSETARDLASKGLEILVEVPENGVCISACNNLFAEGTERIAGANSYFFFHGPSGEQCDLEEADKMIEHSYNTLENYLRVDRTWFAEIKENRAFELEELTYISANEALDVGYATGILPSSEGNNLDTGVLPSEQTSGGTTSLRNRIDNLMDSKELWDPSLKTR